MRTLPAILKRLEEGQTELTWFHISEALEERDAWSEYKYPNLARKTAGPSYDIAALAKAGATAEDWEDLAIYARQVVRYNAIKRPAVDLEAPSPLPQTASDTRLNALVQLGTSAWFHAYSPTFKDWMGRAHVGNCDASRAAVPSYSFDLRDLFGNTMEALGLLGVTQADVGRLQALAGEVYRIHRDQHREYYDNPANRLSALFVYRFFNPETPDLRGPDTAPRELERSEQAVLWQAHTAPGTDFPLYAGGPLIRHQFGLGFSMRAAGEEMVLRVHRTDGRRQVFLANNGPQSLFPGDILQINYGKPLVFSDPTPPPFIGGHQYACLETPERIQAQLTASLSLIATDPRPPPISAFVGFPIRWSPAGRRTICLFGTLVVISVWKAPDVAEAQGSACGPRTGAIPLSS